MGYDVAAGLSPAKYKGWSIEKEIYVPMRDGIRLSTDVLLPNGASEKLGTVLVRTPYDRDVVPKWIEMYLERGYAAVLQNERGHFLSEGYFKNFLQGAGTDGYDTVEWIIRQPWSNGKVGAIGCSSPAEHQWAMAASNPPGFAAMIPVASGVAVGNIPGNETRGHIYLGGVPCLAVWVRWYSAAGKCERLLPPPNSTQEERIRLRDNYNLAVKTREQFTSISTFLHLPSKDILRESGSLLTPFDNYLTWTPADARWDEVDQIGAGATPRIPALHVNTWHDLGIGETTRLFKYLQDLGTPNQHLIIGPGAHCSIFSEWSNKSNLSNLKFGDLEIGDARYQGVEHGWASLFLNWFDYWLKGEQNGILGMPKVQLFVMGRGWISSNRWPLPDTTFTKYYLNADSSGRTAHDTGTLTPHVPDTDERHSYIYDPGAPTPSMPGGPLVNLNYAFEPGGQPLVDLTYAFDQRSIAIRKDVLTYCTPPLEKPVTVVGPIEVVLYVSSSAEDTDFMVKLVDVYPDGKAIYLSEDAFRVRYREGFDKKVLILPGNIYKIALPNMVTAIRFSAGHRIRLDISSSSFPAFERNLNTGGNNYDETSWVVAENNIHLGPQYLSHVVLPVIPEQYNEVIL